MTGTREDTGGTSKGAYHIAIIAFFVKRGVIRVEAKDNPPSSTFRR